MTAAPIANDLTLELAARGASAVVTLRNTGHETLTVFSHVDAGERHYDPFAIVLTRGADSRTLHFYGDRNESAHVLVTLPLGRDLTHVLDLTAWALRPANGARPLAVGHYAMVATYRVTADAQAWNGTLRSAETTLDVP